MHLLTSSCQHCALQDSLALIEERMEETRSYVCTRAMGEVGREGLGVSCSPRRDVEEEKRILMHSTILC